MKKLLLIFLIICTIPLSSNKKKEFTKTVLTITETQKDKSIDLKIEQISMLKESFCLLNQKFENGEREIDFVKGLNSVVDSFEIMNKSLNKLVDGGKFTKEQYEKYKIIVDSYNSCKENKIK